MSLRLFGMLCFMSVIGLLVYGVAVTLSTHPAAQTTPQLEMIIETVVWFGLPLLVAHTIWTNRPISQLLSAICLAAAGYHSFVAIKSKIVEEATLQYIGFGVGLVFLGAMWWLFGSTKLRVYYALIRNVPIPFDIDTIVEDVMAPGPIETLVGRVGKLLAPWLELGVVVLVFVGLWVSVNR